MLPKLGEDRVGGLYQLLCSRAVAGCGMTISQISTVAGSGTRQVILRQWLYRPHIQSECGDRSKP